MIQAFRKNEFRTVIGSELRRAVFVSTTIIVTLAAVSLLSPLAQAENLHRKFGSTWRCSMMSIGPRYDACAECEAKKLEYDDVGGCVTSSSLRLYPNLERDEEERREYRRGQDAVEKEREQLNRHRQIRRWLDSDVSGYSD